METNVDLDKLEEKVKGTLKRLDRFRFTYKPTGGSKFDHITRHLSVFPVSFNSDRRDGFLKPQNVESSLSYLNRYLEMAEDKDNYRFRGDQIFGIYDARELNRGFEKEVEEAMKIGNGGVKVYLDRVFAEAGN